MITWRKSSRSGANLGCVECATWRKSSRSTNNGECVETARLGKTIGIRDSKNIVTSPVLEFSPGEFRQFIKGIKNS